MVENENNYDKKCFNEQLCTYLKQQKLQSISKEIRDIKNKQIKSFKMKSAITKK